MYHFQETLDWINEAYYRPNQLIIRDRTEEPQNTAYGAGTFQLNKKTVRFRVAKTTPTKIGQFVAFWEKNKDNKNQAFSYEQAPDLLVVHTVTADGLVGQFVFPKAVLKKHRILRDTDTKGKMAIRVYPVWDTPTSKQARKTQQWQLPYFVDLTRMNGVSTGKLKDLYSRS